LFSFSSLEPDMPLTPITLRPACYLRGLDGTDAALIKAWSEGKDFALHNGQYCSVRDLNALMEGTSSIWIYNPTTCKAFRIV
jgi:hypothetical protein